MGLKCVELPLTWRLLQCMINAACYKVILDCTPDLVPFYEKNGFQQVGVCMRMTL